MALPFSVAADIYLLVGDVTEFLADETTEAMAQQMIHDVFSQMITHAPIVLETGMNESDQRLVTSILRAAVINYDLSKGGSVSTSQEMAGPFSKMVTTDSKNFRRGLLTGPQIEQLKELQAKLTSTTNTTAQAVEIDLLPESWSRSSSTVWM